MSRPILEIDRLSKMYKLGHSSGRISFDIENWWKNRRGKKNDSEAVATDRDSIWSLCDLSFSVNQGDTFGIIGKNGAGKSTLLKLLSKITKPTKGTIKLAGSIASLLEVGTGFHPDLSGRENIYLNGALLGMRKEDIRKKFDEIVAFSGVEKFLDTAVKKYSSGMYVRLGFSVAAHLQPDILVIDEVLAVGDYEFQQKCLGTMRNAANEGRTILFVSHSLPAIKQLCNKAILLEKGVLKAEGKTEDVLKAYQGNETDVAEGIRGNLPIEQPGYFLSWELTGDRIQGKHTCFSRDRCIFSFDFYAAEALRGCEIRMMIKYEALVIVHCTSADTTKSLITLSEPGKYRFTFDVDLPVRDAVFDIEGVLFSDGKMVDIWLSSTKLVVLDSFNSRVNAGVINSVSQFKMHLLAGKTVVP